MSNEDIMLFHNICVFKGLLGFWSVLVIQNKFACYSIL